MFDEDQELLVVTFGQAVQDSYGVAIRAWLLQYRGSRSSEEMMVNHCMAVEVDTLRRDNVNLLTINVTVRGKRGTPSDQYFFRYERVAESGFKLVTHTKV